MGISVSFAPPRCRELNQREREKVAKVCPCGAEFKTRKATYCSMRCESRGERIKCKGCGAEFRKYEQQSRSIRTYCSSGCFEAALAKRRAVTQQTEEAAKRKRSEARTARLNEAAKRQMSRRSRKCQVCGCEFQMNRIHPMVCSDWCWRESKRIAKRNIKRTRRARKLGLLKERYQDRDIFVRDRWRCWICKKVVDRTAKAPDPASPSVDHVIPLSKGGVDAPWNVHCACFSCNRSKGELAITLW